MTHLTLWLGQLQFFFGLGFMLMFMALELGLVWVLLFFKVKALTTGKSGWLEAYRFWVRVFALACVITFAGGVSVFLQFASLWPQLIERTGDVLGPMIAASVAITFILKAGLLGVMLYGSRNFPNVVHMLVVVIVAIGITASAFFLMAAISWTHTPAGSMIFNGHYVPLDGWNVLFNPALPWYGLLFVSISFAGAGFLIMAVVSGQTKLNPVAGQFSKAFRSGLVIALAGLVINFVALTGSVQLSVQHQPAKAAAIAGYWNSSPKPEFLLFGWPNQSASKNHAALLLDNSGSGWLAYNEEDAQWRGLDEFSGMAPPVALIFWSFRLIVLCAVILALIAVITWFLLRKHSYEPARLAQRWRRLLILCGPSGALLLLLGLAYIQFGALPYAVYGSITISEVFSLPNLTELVITNILYAACYVVLMAGFVFLLRYIVRYGVVPVGRQRGRA